MTNAPVPDAARSLRLGRALRARREELGLPLSVVAARCELDTADLAAYEAGALPSSRPDLHTLAAALLLRYEDLVGFAADRPSRGLDRAAEAWLWSPVLLSALGVAREWLEFDEYLTSLAVPSFSGDFLAGRGVPEAALPALVPVALPAPPASPPLPPFGPPWPRVRSAVLALRSALPLPTWAPVTAPALAEAAGVPVGRAPLDLSVRGVVVSPGGVPLLVLNSRHAPSVRDRSLAHLLAHLLAGDVTPAVVDVLEDQDDDSVHACAGTTWRSCSSAGWVGAGLLDPADVLDAEQRMLDQGDARDAGLWVDAPFSPPSLLPPVGGVPGEWDAVEVWVSPQPLRRLLGVTHDDLLVPGGDELTAWPPALADRYLAVVSRGLTPPTRLASLGLQGAADPRAGAASLAAARFEAVSAQLERSYSDSF